VQVKHEEAKTSTQLPPGGMTCRPLGTDKVTSVSKVRASRSVRAGMLLMNVTDPPASTLTASGVVTCEMTTVAVGAAPAGVASSGTPRSAMSTVLSADMAVLRTQRGRVDASIVAATVVGYPNM